MAINKLTITYILQIIHVISFFRTIFTTLLKLKRKKKLNSLNNFVYKLEAKNYVIRKFQLNLLPRLIKVTRNDHNCSLLAEQFHYLVIIELTVT